MLFSTGSSNDAKLKVKSNKKGQPVMRQKTISSYFFMSNKCSPEFQKKITGKSSGNRDESKTEVVDLEKPKVPSTKPSLLFDSQGSFDECDRDEELRRLIEAPKLNNFKKASINGVPGLKRSSSSIQYDFSDSESPKKMITVTSNTRQLSFTSNVSLSFNEGARPSKRTGSPTAFAGLRLTAPKRLKPISRKSSNLTAKETLKLTREQETVLELVVKKKLSIFYTGSAGTGKSVILKTLIDKLKSIYGKDGVAVTASTGLAGTTIGGTTLHKWSGVGIGTKSVDQLVKNIQKQNQMLAMWKNTRVLIIDEISMIDGNLLDKLELIARRLRRNEKPFGGIQLVLTGDFFQLPPVQRKSDYQQGSTSPAIFCFESKMWKRCVQRTILLTKVFRQQDDELIMMLNSIRFGEINPQLINSIKSLSREVQYGDGIAPTELYATRREVEISNARQLEMLPGKAYRFESVDAAPKQYITLLDSSVMVERILTLKNDAQVMMLKNKPESELVNGSVGRVLFFITERLERLMKESFSKIDDDVISDMRIVSEAIANPIIVDSLEFQQSLLSRPLSRHSTLKTLVNHAIKSSPKTQIYPYIRWALGDRFHHELMLQERFPLDIPGEKIGIERNQLPLMLCWALSIHKAQGQTIQRLKVDLRNIFEAGQVYVALSRAVSKNSLQVLNFNPKRIRADEKVKSFYKDLEVLA